MVSTTTNGKTRSRSATKKAVSDLEASLSSREPEDEKIKKVKRERKAKIEKDIADVTFDKVAQTITKTELDIGKALQGVNAAVKEQVELLENLREAKSLLEEEIETLHGKEIAASAIDIVLAEYNEKKEALEAEIAQKQADWEKETKAHAEFLKQRNDKVARDWEQEKLDHEYEVRKARREEEEKWEQQEKARKSKLAEFEDEKKREWKEREKAISEREQRLAELEQIEATLEARIEEAKKAERDATTSKLIATHKNELKFATMELQSEIKSKDQSIQSLQQQLADLKSALDKSQKETSSLQEKVQAMAVASLEASSGKSALEAVNAVIEKQGGKK